MIRKKERPKTLLVNANEKVMLLQEIFSTIFVKPIQASQCKEVSPK
jgi:hypothetical protein